MLRKIHGTNFFHIKFWLVLTSNVKLNQCCPKLRFFILMVRLYLRLFLIAKPFWENVGVSKNI
jgi:hypothetical protein